MGRKRMYPDQAARQKAYEERQRESLEGVHEQALEEDALWEQAVRDHFGYAASETRTWAERKGAADAMLRGTVRPPRLDPVAEARARAELVSQKFREAGVWRDPVSEAGRADRAEKYARDHAVRPGA